MKTAPTHPSDGDPGSALDERLTSSTPYAAQPARKSANKTGDKRMRLIVIALFFLEFYLMVGQLQKQNNKYRYYEKPYEQPYAAVPAGIKAIGVHGELVQIGVAQLIELSRRLVLGEP